MSQVMKIDAVFSGGGLKGFAYIGTLEAIYEKNFELGRVAGTSSGSIMAALLASGYSLEAIKHDLYQLDIDKLLDPPLWSRFIPFGRWFSAFFKLGMYKGDRLEEWLYHQLLAKEVRTFGDLPEGYLKVVASDISLEKLVVIPDDLERLYGIQPNQFAVASAVRMSAGFPYIFQPKKIAVSSGKRFLLIDGGILSNFPLWTLAGENGRQERPVLGLRLREMESGQSTPSITSAIQMFKGIFSTMKLAHDQRYVTTSERDNTIYIPVEGIHPTDFSITTKQKKELAEYGYDHAREFLKRWPV